MEGLGWGAGDGPNVHIPCITGRYYQTCRKSKSISSFSFIRVCGTDCAALFLQYTSEQHGW